MASESEAMATWAGAGNPGREPIVGWRLWRVRQEGLRSWAATSYWVPGANSATCLASDPCPRSPGSGCKCGFWALFSLSRCLEYARRDAREGMTVLGLVQAWGEVSLHGEEGFRSASAAVVALFTDWVWEADLQPRNRAHRWWRQLVHALGAGCPRPPTPPDPEREQLVAGAARRYGVPVLGLEDALCSGFLAEMGVSAKRREEVRRLLERRSASGGGSKDGGPEDHGVSDAA